MSTHSREDQPRPNSAEESGATPSAGVSGCSQGSSTKRGLIARIKNSPYYHVIEIIGSIWAVGAAVGAGVVALIAVSVQHHNVAAVPVTRIVTQVQRIVVHTHDVVVLHDKWTEPRSPVPARGRSQIPFVPSVAPSDRFGQAPRSRLEYRQSRPSSALMKSSPVTVVHVARKRSPATGALVGGGGCGTDCGWDRGGCDNDCGGNTPPGIGCGDCGATTNAAVTDAVIPNNSGDAGCGGCESAVADPSRTSKAVPQAGMSSAKETSVPSVGASP